MKKHVIIFCIVIGVIICLAVVFMVDYFALVSPIPYSIYINEEKVEGICVYMYQGYIFAPVLGMMELHNYEVKRTPGENPEFVINGDVYQLDIENKRIQSGKKIYLGEVTGGRCFIEIDDKDVYTLLMEINIFFEWIGKEPIKANGIDYWNKCVYYEIDDNIELQEPEK